MGKNPSFNDLITKLTPKQEEAYEQMLKNFPELINIAPDVKDEMHISIREKSDELKRTLVRYLRARNFDVKQSTTLLRDTLEWRKSFGLDQGPINDEILNDPESGVWYWMTGAKNKTGIPVLFCLPGACFPSKVNPTKYVRAIVCLAEKICYRSDSEPLCVLVDFGNWSLRQNFSKSLLREAGTILQNHYPECLTKTYVINQPKALTLVWKILRSIMDKETRAKFMFLGKDWKKPIGEEFDLDQLPAHLGGSHSYVLPLDKTAKVSEGEDDAKALKELEKEAAKIQDD